MYQITSQLSSDDPTTVRFLLGANAKAATQILVDKGYLVEPPEDFGKFQHLDMIRIVFINTDQRLKEVLEVAASLNVIVLAGTM